MPARRWIVRISTVTLLSVVVSAAFVATGTPPRADAETFTAGLASISGTSDDSGNQNGMSATQVSAGATGGPLSKVSVYFGSVNAAPRNHGQVAVYADANNLPGAKLAASETQTLAKNKWNDFPLTGVTVAPSTKYWLVFNVDGANTKYKILRGQGGRSAWKIPTTFGTWSDPFGAPNVGPNAEQYALTMTWDGTVVPPTSSTAPPPTSTAPPTTTTAPPTNCAGQNLAPGANVQAAIDAAPSGTTFCFAPGTYTNVSALAPKANDVFDGGNRAAILDGQNTSQYAFRSSTASGVTVRGFTIKQYNTPLQEGAVHSFGATNWTIDNNLITQNAATGVATDTGARVLNNQLNGNGQQGYAAHGANLLYEGNEIAGNNPNLAVDATWEAGGGKAWDTQDAVFRNNNVHDNGGNGLWDDTNNIRITYDSNIVDNNWGAGIYHEIGYDATIVNNTISRNGMSSSPGGGQDLGWLWNAGIQIRSSRALDAATPMLIANNTVTNNYNGIALLDSPSSGCSNAGEGRYGPCYLQNILVRDNTVSMTIGGTGVVEDGRGLGVFGQNLIWTNNHYAVANMTTHPDDGHAYGWFAWNDEWPSWAEWQSFGNDTTGTYGPIAP